MAANLLHTLAAISSFLFTELLGSARSLAFDLEAWPFRVLENSSNTFRVRLNMGEGKTILESTHILAAYASAVHTFVVFCTVYPISLLATYVPAKRKGYLTIVVHISEKLCMKIRSSNVEGLVFDRILFGLLTVDISIDCKNKPPL